MQYLIASIQQHPINDRFGPHPRGPLPADPGLGEPLDARGFALLVETRGRRRVSVLGLGQRRQRLLGAPGEEPPAQLILLACCASDDTRAGKCAKRAGGLQRKRLQPALPLELDGLLPGLLRATDACNSSRTRVVRATGATAVSIARMPLSWRFSVCSALFKVKRTRG